MMQAALLWYETYTTCLKINGFKLCKYDPCIAKKMINEKQCTIAWHVDDSKISHVDPGVVTNVIRMIEERFNEVTVSRGKTHTFLGMDIELRDDGMVFLGMQEYLEEIIVTFGEAITGKAPTPDTSKLFVVNESEL